MNNARHIKSKNPHHLRGKLSSGMNFASHNTAYVNYFNVSEYITSDGSVAAHYEYDPFGNTTLAEGPLTVVFPLRYSTKYTDSESGFIYYGYRYLEPLTGRWLNRDPIEEEGGVLIYGFVHNDAIALWDLLGQVSKFVNRCQQIVDFRDGINIVPPVPDDGKNKKCKSLVDSLMKNLKIKQYTDKFDKDKGCPLPTVNCECCESYEKDGNSFEIKGIYHRGTDKSITICSNAIKDGMQGTFDLENTLIHEHIHALQDCAGGLDGCEGSLRREIEARYCAAGKNGTFDGLLYDALASSCGSHCKDAAEIGDLYKSLKDWFNSKKSKGNNGGKLCEFNF